MASTEGAAGAGLGVTFASKEEFSSSYQRNNKKGGKKHLRCFPHCGPCHRTTHACETPIPVALSDPGKGFEDQDVQRFMAIARFLPLKADNSSVENDDITDAFGDMSVGSDISIRRLESFIRSVDDPFQPLYMCRTGKLEAARIVFVFKEKAWHYGWKGGRYKQDTNHVLRVYIFRGQGTLLKNGALCGNPDDRVDCVAAVSSTPFTLISSRTALTKKTEERARLNVQQQEQKSHADSTEQNPQDHHHPFAAFAAEGGAAAGAVPFLFGDAQQQPRIEFGNTTLKRELSTRYENQPASLVPAQQKRQRTVDQHHFVDSGGVYFHPGQSASHQNWHQQQPPRFHSEHMDSPFTDEYAERSGSDFSDEAIGNILLEGAEANNGAAAAYAEANTFAAVNASKANPPLDQGQNTGFFLSDRSIQSLDVGGSNRSLNSIKSADLNLLAPTVQAANTVHDDSIYQGGEAGFNRGPVYFDHPVFKEQPREEERDLVKEKDSVGASNVHPKPLPTAPSKEPDQLEKKGTFNESGEATAAPIGAQASIIAVRSDVSDTQASSMYGSNQETPPVAVAAEVVEPKPPGCLESTNLFIRKYPCMVVLFLCCLVLGILGALYSANKCKPPQPPRPPQQPRSGERNLMSLSNAYESANVRLDVAVIEALRDNRRILVHKGREHPPGPRRRKPPGGKDDGDGNGTDDGDGNGRGNGEKEEGGGGEDSLGSGSPDSKNTPPKNTKCKNAEKKLSLLMIVFGSVGLISLAISLIQCFAIYHHAAEQARIPQAHAHVEMATMSHHSDANPISQV